MPTIEIKQETLEFLQGLIKEINKQDNRITATPYYYTIQEKELVEDHNGEAHYFDGEGEITKEELEQMSPDDFAHTYGLDQTIDDVLDDCNMIYMSEKWVEAQQSNVFLTEKAAENYIAQNSYHYNKPRTFVRHFWRNHEIKRLFRAIEDVAGVKLDWH
jgi:hypothetical protein